MNSNDPTGLCVINGEEFPDPCYSANAYTSYDVGGGGGGGPHRAYSDSDRPNRGGGGGAVPLTNWQLMFRVLARAIEALSLNTKCMDLFGTAQTGQSGFNPVNVLTSIVTKGQYAHIVFVDEKAKWGVAEVTGSGNNIKISINEYNDGVLPYWNLGNTDMNAETLLHELGHVYDSIPGSGNSVIKSPDSIPLLGNSRGRWNDWKIDQDCFGGALGFKKP